MPKYYCIMRPPAPGAIPKGAVEVNSYADRRYVPEIDRMAWGWAEYPGELALAEVAACEMIREPRTEEDLT